MTRSTIATVVATTVIALIFVGGLFAQDTDADTPQYVRAMVRAMESSGWDDESLTEFERACLAHQWEGLQQTDPALLVRALRYAHEYGDSEEGLNVRNQAALAHELAYQAQRMSRFGIDDRRISRTIAGATRDSLRSMSRAELSNAEVGDLLRTRLQDASQARVRDYDRLRTRDQEPTGTAARYGEDREPGQSPGTPPGAPPSDAPGPHGPHR